MTHHKGKVAEIMLLGLSELRIQEALLLYQRGTISIGRGAELADLLRDEFIRQALARGIQPRWDEGTVETELA